MIKKLNDIPIRIEKPANSMLPPILHELTLMLKTLMSNGKTNMLDLRHEPIDLKEIASLKNLLGQGEIDVNFTAMGTITNIRETSISGIWWHTHHDQEGNVTSEMVEITTCPELLKTVPDELESALVKLQEKISQHKNALTPEQIAARLNTLGFSSVSNNTNAPD
jgi:HupH hydrogenase expression protein